MFYWVVTAAPCLDAAVCAMSYFSDLTDEPWALLEPVFNAPGKHGPRHAPGLRPVVDATLYVCPYRLPMALPVRVVRALDAGVAAVAPLVRNGTWTRVLTVLHAAAREADRVRGLIARSSPTWTAGHRRRRNL